jgi:cardiolipin synthase
MSWRQLPNIITIARMLAVLPLLWFLREHQYRPALAIALIAGLSDGVDGWLAKRYDWRTRLGGLLDPIADKLLLDGSFVGLWLAGAAHGCANVAGGSALPAVAACAGVTAAPLWLVLLVLARDAVIVTGASAYHFLIGPLKGQPTLLGKVTTVAQIVLVLALLCGLAWRPLPMAVATAAIWIVAALTIASGIDYVLRWSLKTRRALRERAS